MGRNRHKYVGGHDLGLRCEAPRLFSRESQRSFPHMVKPAKPANETDRLKSLHAYRILDTAAEAEFDDLTRLASQICGTPISLISLIDADRQWFKSKVGFSPTQSPRDVVFCAHAILTGDLFIVSDARKDARFADNPFVTGEPHIRFYAGVPLIGEEGYALGTLCVMDRVARELDAEQSDALRALARQAVSQMRLRRSVATLTRSLAQQRNAEEWLRENKALLQAHSEASPDGILVVAPSGEILLRNRRLAELWGIVPELAQGRDDAPLLRAAQERAADPDAFLAGVAHLYDHPDQISHDEVVLKNGRVLDRHSAPLCGQDGTHFGRVWYFRDVTD
ncbi:MAG: DNA-binding response regulator, OmpR family, containings and winged-helix, partial [Phycisphaerales bacterium]|nr:DNA-binding response regulator, OmpR family, containings and winged-helix [Phycisphaerales bacterium]